MKQSGSDQLVKAWLHGDWDIIDGAFFDCFDHKLHVLDSEWPYFIPKNAPRIRSFDWGSAKPFSVGWYAVSDGTWGLPKDALFKYREWYGAKGINEGLKMSSKDVAEGILIREKGEIIKDAVADPSIFIRNGGPSIGEEMAKHGVSFRRADNKRIPGWEQLRVRLIGSNGVPMLYFCETCVDSIRTIPSLQHGVNNLEDINTDMEDHAADDVRYAVMSRPWIPTQRKEGNIVVGNVLNMPINDIIKQRTAKRLEGLI